MAQSKQYMKHLVSPLTSYHRWAKSAHGINNSHRILDESILSANNETTTLRLEDEHDEIEHTEDCPEWGSPKFLEAYKHLPPLEQECLEQYYRQNIYQRDIGKNVGRSQSNVCRRLYTAAARLRYWATMPPLPPEGWWQRYIQPSKQTRVQPYEIIYEFAKDCSQSATAERLSVKLGRHVRQCAVYDCLHRVHGKLERMHDTCTANEEVTAMLKWIEHALQGQFMTLRYSDEFRAERSRRMTRAMVKRWGREKYNKGDQDVQ